MQQAFAFGFSLLARGDIVPYGDKSRPPAKMNDIGADFNIEDSAPFAPVLRFKSRTPPGSNIRDMLFDLFGSLGGLDFRHG